MSTLISWCLTNDYVTDVGVLITNLIIKSLLCKAAGFLWVSGRLKRTAGLTG